MNQVRDTVGVAVVRALEAHGVEIVFGIPGTHNLELYRGLAASPIRHVVPRHEQGGGYAADAYARVTGRPGVLVTTSGPGLLNALTALATAYADSVPVLVVSPGPPTGLEGADVGWLHEMKDQQGTADGAVASIRCLTGERAVAAVYETFSRWAVERPRPVHLEIPVDVLESAWHGGAPARPVAPLPPAPAAAAVTAAADLLREAQRPVLVVGGGATGAAPEVRALAERLDAPLVTTASGKGVLDEGHSLAVGPFLRSPAVAALVAGSDVLLVVGSELSIAEVDGRLDPGGAVIRVDLAPGQLHKNLRADVPVLADAATTLAALLAALPGPQPDRAGAERAERARRAARAELTALAPRLRAVQDAVTAELPDDAIVTGDSSQVSYLATGPFWPARRPRSHLVPTGFATLGFALPAAIGAKLAAPDREVVAVLGDGAFLFSVQELGTAVQEHLGVVVVVVDNGGYGEIRRGMQQRGIPPLAVDLVRPDIVALAEAFGARGARAESPVELGKHVAAALAADVPTVVVIDEAVVPAPAG